MKRHRILLVEDDIVDREHARRTLDETGLPYTIDEAANATEAMNKSDFLGYDCILLDYRLPEGNSLELFQHILQQPCTRRPPVIMLTGMGSEDIAVEAMKCGAQDYLSKASLDAASMTRAIEAAIGRADLETRAEQRTKELEHLSHYDALTDLPNRTLFAERFEQLVHLADRNVASFAVLAMDLNRFKEVNDTYGHDAGDEVLRAVAQRLRDASRDSDTFARLGGDEFAAILPTTRNPAGAAVFAARIAAQIGEPIVYGDTSLQIGTSIGIAFFPDHANQLESLLAAADQAMYEAKRGGTGYTIYDPSDAVEGGAPDSLGADFAKALAGDQIVLHYQPQVNLRSGEVVGVEALVRWQHPTLGLLPPMEFLPAIQDTDILKDFTLHTVSLAAAQAKVWSDRGYPLGVSLHYSARLLEDESLPDEIVSRVIAAGTPTDRFTVEVTESGLMAAPYQAARVLKKLASAGIRIALDEFGAGYSSLRYLSELEVREIKVDRMFVNAADNRRERAIIRSIVELGLGMSTRVVAEGIENESVLAYLLEVGCRYGQGNYFCRPVDAIQFIDWYETRLAELDRRAPAVPLKAAL